MPSSLYRHACICYLSRLRRLGWCSHLAGLCNATDPEALNICCTCSFTSSPVTVLTDQIEIIRVATPITTRRIQQSGVSLSLPRTRTCTNSHTPRTACAAYTTTTSSLHPLVGRSISHTSRQSHYPNLAAPFRTSHLFAQHLVSRSRTVFCFQSLLQRMFFVSTFRSFMLKSRCCTCYTV